MIINIAWFLIASGLGWYVLERNKPKEQQAAGFISIITIASWFVFKTFQRATITSPGGTPDEALFYGTLFGGAFLLISIGLKWFLIRKKQLEDDIERAPSALEVKDPETAPSPPQVPRANIKSIAIQKKIILVLVTVTIAVGSIYYLHSNLQHKIGTYLVKTERIDWYLTLAAHEKPLVLDTMGYTHRKMQLFAVYRTSIIVVALGLSYVILMPRKRNE